MNLDQTTVAVIKGAMESICDEMDQHLIHAALSPIISETNDCAHGIYHPVTGETIAQGRFGLPVFMANMQFTVQTVIRRANELGGFRPGDMWILNDPYTGGTHLNDVNLVVPVYHHGELIALMANTGHWMDIGGSIPGGWIPAATNIHEEGLLIPPVRLYEDGKVNQGVIDLITGNVRLPDMIFGDMTAMNNALRSGENALLGLVERYGIDVVRACQDEMILRSEREMRSYIAEIPDGVYTQVDYLDNDGIDDIAHEFRAKVTVEGDQMTVDFTGTSAAAKGPINLSRNTSISSIYIALKHIFPDVPVNGGTFRPVTCIIPEQSIIAARYPSPVSGYLEVVGRVLDTVFGALAQAIPERVPAPSFGTTGVVTVAGHHPMREDYYVGVFPYPGGYGGSAASDGQVNGTTPQSMANFMSLEVAEHRFPLRFDYFAMRENSAGPGKHRGGTGTSYGFTAWADLTTSVLGDRVDHVPFGIAGGKDAQPNTVRFRTNGQEWAPPLRSKYAGLTLRPGDSVMVGSPGGAGFGDPLDRDPDSVRVDLDLGVVSVAAAEQDYGVVAIEVQTIAGRPSYEIDASATTALRQRLREHRGKRRHNGNLSESHTATTEVQGEGR